MKLRLFDTLSKVNTTLSLTDRVIALVLLFLPPGLLVGAYSTRDRLWDEYGWLGAVVLALLAVFVTGVGCGGIALLIMAHKPPKAENPPTSAPLLPIHTSDLAHLFARAARNLMRSEEASTPQARRAAVNKIYDALRSGDISCWGFASKFYPPETTPPFAPRVFIPPEFWSEHTIEELDKIAEAQQLDEETPWESITKPGETRFKRREVVQCYWDLTFDSDDVRRRWPLRHDWMAS
jgi:hypothetical protein